MIRVFTLARLLLVAVAMQAMSPASSLADQWLLYGPPTGRTMATGAIDAPRDRFLVFGGNDGANHNDVWYYDLAGSTGWHSVATQGDSPPPRSGAAGVFDPVTDRLIIFGGYSDETPYLRDTWALDFGSDPPAWTQVASDPALTARYRHSAVIDPNRRRMLVYGGNLQGSFEPANDVWSFSLDSLTWSPVVPSGSVPAGRESHVAVFDVARDRMLILQGATSTDYARDTWALEFTPGPHWTQVVTAPPGTGIPGRDHCGVLDPSRDRAVELLNGEAQFASHAILYLTDPPSWGSLSNPDGILKRKGAVAALDAERDRMIVFGGEGLFVRGSELLSFNLSNPYPWTAITPTSNEWAARCGHGWVHDTSRDRMIVFAGFNHLDLGETHPNDVWALQLADPAQRIRLWPSGQAPIRPNLDRSRAIYDPVRDRMILFDGLEPGGTCSHQVWSFDLAESTGWQQITTSGSPTYGCWDHSAVYDPVRDRVLCYGGWNASTDVWSLPLTDAAPTWSRLTTGGPTPYNRREHAMIYDPVRDRLLLFAGRDGGSEYFDLWELKLSGTPTWRKLMEHQPELPMPKRGLLNVSMLYDPVGDRLLAFGGRDDAQYDYLNVHYNSVWSLPLAADSLAWEELHPSGSLPSGRELAAAVFDATRNQMVIFGGATTRTQVPSVDVLKLSPPLAVPTHPVKRLTLAPAHPNPSTGNVRLSFQLHATSRVHLAIYDLQGRKIATLAEEVREAGEHSEVWSGRSSTGAMAPTGVYIARLQVGSESIVRRIVRMR